MVVIEFTVHFYDVQCIKEFLKLRKKNGLRCDCEAEQKIFKMIKNSANSHLEIDNCVVMVCALKTFFQVFFSVCFHATHKNVNWPIEDFSH